MRIRERNGGDGMARNSTTRWYEERFAYVIKAHLLYGDKTRVITELPEGDCFVAEVGDTEYMGEEWINLILRYVDTAGNAVKSVVLEWFPEDEKLLDAVRILRSTEEQPEEQERAV